MIAMKDKRFIEESFPAKEVSEISAKRKNIRHGHIYYIWWARRPLASSRATNYAALIPAPEDSKMRRWYASTLKNEKMCKIYIG